MRIRATLLLGVVLACGSWNQARAQRDHVFRFTTPLRLSAGHDENFIFRGRELDDTVYLLTAPTFSLVKEGQRTGFFFGYQPEFEFFVRHPDLNAVSHEATLQFGHRVTPRLTIEFGDTFGYMQDPTRRFAEGFLRLPRTPFQLNVLHGGFSYDLSRRNRLDFRLENTISKVPVPGVFDQIGTVGTISLTRALTPKHEIAVSYAHLRNRFLEKPHETATLADLAKEADSVGGSYTYKIPSLIIRLAGGAIRAGQIGYTAAGSVEKRLGRVWAESSYQRYLSLLGGLSAADTFFGGPESRGLLPTALIETFAFRLHGKLTDRFGMDLRGLRSQTDTGMEIDEIRSLMGRCRLDFQLTERLVLFGNVDYFGQNLNEFLRIPMSRKRYFGGLEVNLMRTVETRDASRRPRETGEEGAAEPGAARPRRALIRRGMER